MKATVNEMYQRLVQTLYASNLHFYLQETPFSAQILIRKKFQKDGTIPSSIGLISQNEAAQGQIIELQKKVKESSELINVLECKLEKAESKTLLAYDGKKHEVDILKSSIKKSEHELRSRKSECENRDEKIKKRKQKDFEKQKLQATKSRSQCFTQ